MDSIPRNIFQTHKSIQYVRSNEKLRKSTQSWKGHPEFNYYFYNDQDCERLIEYMETIFPGIKKQYDRLPMNVMKADVWRYCVIYVYGGIYADVDAVLLTDPNIFINHKNIDLVIAPENSIHICQWTFSARKNSPVLKTIIQEMVNRLENTPEIFGEHIIHELTGPCNFTRGISKYLEDSGLIVNEDDKYSHWFSIYKFLDSKDLKNLTQTDINKLSMQKFLLNKSNEGIGSGHADQRIGWVYFLLKEYGTEKLAQYNILLLDRYMFHTKIIRHLFSGSWSDGWTHERREKLMNPKTI